MAKILMTGCSSGFGASVREDLLSRGHKVYGMGLGGPNIDANFNHHTNLDLWASTVFEQIAKEMGEPDVLINNAGTMELNFIEDYSCEQLQRSLRVNLEVPIVLMRGFVIRKRKQRELPLVPRVINTCSMVHKTPSRACPGYVASKAGLEAVTRAFAREVGNPFIFASIAPGPVDMTPMMGKGLDHLQKDRGMSELEAKQYMTANPLGRMIRHEEIVAIYRFAVEEMPAAMSGTTLTVPLACGA